MTIEIAARRPDKNESTKSLTSDFSVDLGSEAAQEEKPLSLAPAPAPSGLETGAPDATPDDTPHLRPSSKQSRKRKQSRHQSPFSAGS